jgi:hypothetical protein
MACWYLAKLYTLMITLSNTITFNALINPPGLYLMNNTTMYKKAHYNKSTPLRCKQHVDHY